MTREEALQILDTIPTIGEQVDALELAIKVLSMTCSEKPNNWISVSERLPEKDTDVLAYVKGVGIVYQRVMWIDDYTSEWVGFAGSGYQDEVIAWMPLPEPYEEESEGVE